MNEIPLHTQIEYLRTIIIGIVTLVLLVSVVVPIIYTIIPYRREFGKPSWALKSRLYVRILFFLLAFYNLMLLALKLFGIMDLTGPSAEAVTARNLSLPVYLAILTLLIYTWHKHPDGIKGL